MGHLEEASYIWKKSCLMVIFVQQSGPDITQNLLYLLIGNFLPLLGTCIFMFWENSYGLTVVPKHKHDNGINRIIRVYSHRGNRRHFERTHTRVFKPNKRKSDVAFFIAYRPIGAKVKIAFSRCEYSLTEFIVFGLFLLEHTITEKTNTLMWLNIYWPNKRRQIFSFYQGRFFQFILHQEIMQLVIFHHERSFNVLRTKPK